MELKYIMLSEINQKEKDKIENVLSHIWNIKIHSKGPKNAPQSHRI